MSETLAIVDAATLASSLGSPYTTAKVQQTVDWVNELVTDEWLYPADPVPVRIKLLAYGVATRALQNPKGLESWTLTHDETSRTERLPAEYRRAGIYLTDDELEVLKRKPEDQVKRRRKFRTIRTAPGYR